MSAALVLQSPQPARALFLLFHGVGASPRDLVPLGQRLAQWFPEAAVVSIPSPDPSELGAGLQWFSVLGVTEENRPARVAATLPRFVQVVREWQQRTGVAPADTTLLGFSQGAIMALEAAGTQPLLAGRIVSLAGRYAQLPEAAPAGVRFHFVHGQADPVIPAAQAQRAAQALAALQAPVTLDLLPGLGHGIDGTAAERLLQRLRTP